MKEDSTDHLIQRLLDGELSDSERVQLNDALRAAPEARARYRRALALHSALIRRDPGNIPDFVIRKAPTTQAPAPSRKFPYAIAALIAIAATITAVDYLAVRKHRPRAEMTSTSQAIWPAGTRSPDLGELASKTPLELISGQVELGYPSGARVVLEGPCRFSLDSKEALTVLHGRATVHAPEGAEGFRLDTPGGTFIDRGTEFGIAVGSDGSRPVVLTEVFKGEIDFSKRDPEGARQEVRLSGGQSRAIIDDGRILNELDESPVHLVNALHRTIESPTKTKENLALGKPVMSPGYCTRPHGSVFPPDNLTDGRLDDSGVPGDWSFWLAPDGEHGEFTIDLLSQESVSRVSLQNTTNRSINDRGVESFVLLGSTDNRDFFPLVEGDLPRLDPDLYGQSLPFTDFTFEPTEIRYLKCIVTSHFRHPKRRPDNECQGGGLNEVRVFAE